jgi:hypothetical protein
MNKQAMILAVTLAIVGTVSMSLAQQMSQQPGDPDRWYQPNVTPMERHRGAMKESAAALKEALTDCRNVGASYRSPCMTNAREQQRKDISAANARLVEETATWHAPIVTSRSN